MRSHEGSRAIRSHQEPSGGVEAHQDHQERSGAIRSPLDERKKKARLIYQPSLRSFSDCRSVTHQTRYR